MSPMLKAISVGVGVFVVMMLLFYGIARLAGRPFLTIPRRVTTPSPSELPSSPTLPLF